MSNLILVGGVMWTDIGRLTPKTRMALWEAVLERLAERGMALIDGDSMVLTSEGEQALQQVMAQLEQRPDKEMKQ